jgi:hypothetical protein
MEESGQRGLHSVGETGTHDDVHALVEAVVDDEVVSHFNAMWLHRVDCSREREAGEDKRSAESERGYMENETRLTEVECVGSDIICGSAR